MRRPEQMLILTVIALLGPFGQNVMARGTVVVENQFPVKNEFVRIHITGDDGYPVEGANVEVTYRPGSRVQQTDHIGASAADGTIRWAPAEAGIATITATWTGPGQTERKSATSVSIKFRSPPLDGILIMIVAGVLLVVGTVIRIFALLRTPQAP
jgi:hypothetical protein